MNKQLVLTNLKKKILTLALTSFYLFAMFSPGLISAAVPVASFSVSSMVCAFNTYTITDLSTNAPTAWSYTVDDGTGNPTVLGVQNPTVSFFISGTYTISMVSSNASGSSAVFTKTINVLDWPGELFSQSNYTTCSGGSPVSLTLTPVMPGNLNNTYLWSNGSTNNSISVTPSVTTVYSVVITGTNGCTITDMSTVTVSPASLTITSVPANICPGTTSTLTATGAGPTPRTFSWSTNNTGGVLTSSVSGVFTATMTTGAGCKVVQTYSLGTSTTLSLTVRATPTIACAGSSVVIRATGASNYTWSTGSTTPNTTVTPTTSTTYTIRGVIGACSGTAALNLSVSVTPTVAVIATSDTLCAGTTVTLSATGANNFTINPGGIVASSAVVTPSANTTYSIRGQNVGCPVRTATLDLLVLPNPVLSISSNTTISCAGEPIALSVNGANTYTWSNGSNMSVIIINPTVSSVYSVSALSSNGCAGTSSINLTVNECTGLNELSGNESDFKFYPNPATGKLYLSSSSNELVKIIDLTGKLVLTVLTEASRVTTADISDLKPGIYFIKSTASATGVVFSKKLIVY